MTTHPGKMEQPASVLSEEDFPTPSCLTDFVWPEGAELRGNINLVAGEMIDREEVATEWNRIKKKLLKKLA